MTESKETKNDWNSNQNWIKDVLSKSGTNLMEIGKNVTITSTSSASMASSTSQTATPTTGTTAIAVTTATTKNGMTLSKRGGRQKNAGKECQQIKMVYNPSTQLIAKNEQTSQQVQFCTPLRAVAASTASPSSVSSMQGYSNNNQLQNETIILQQTSQQPQSISLMHNNGNTNGHHYLVANIKKEYMTTTTSSNNLNIKQEFIPSPSISLFARTTTPTAAAAAAVVASTTNQLCSKIFNIDADFDNENPKSITILQTQKQQQQQQQQQLLQQQHQQLQQHQTVNNSDGIMLTTTTTTAAPTMASSTSLSSTSLSSSQNSTGPTAVTVTTKTTAGGRKVTTAVNKFKCEQCGMTFGSKSAHTSHVKSHARSGDYSGVAKNATDLNNINAVEVNEAGVPIGIPKTPPLKPNANAHITGGDPYQCNVCQKTFAVPARLIRHYRTHTGERPFECEFCHKLFSVKENLQVHRRIHTKERPYKCDVCGRAFEHSGKLHRHMRIHTGERPHKCSVCEKTFIQSGQLVIHMRTHTGEKPYKCPVEGCGKGFTCSKQLKVHSRTHTGEKPYHCDICFRDFGYNHVLKLHRVQHYGSKCYKCTICDKTFKSKKEMEAHIKGHANEMPDDDDPEASASNGGNSIQTSSLSSSGGETTTSAPASPQSPAMATTTTAATIATSIASASNKTSNRKPRQGRGRPSNNHNQVVINPTPSSPSSPRSTYSPPSSLASTSRQSAGSPASPINAIGRSNSSLISSALLLETDVHLNSSRDSGIASTSHQQRTAPHLMAYNVVEEMPTDLSITTQASRTNGNNYYKQEAATYSYIRHSPIPIQTVGNAGAMTEAMPREEHIINPALVEAIDIASRRDAGEEEVTQAALQMMQLHRSRAEPMQQLLPVPQQQHQQSHPSALTPAVQSVLLEHGAEMSSVHHQDDDAIEANELIEHYKRGDLARHGLHKRFAPVPKFEASNESMALVRQIEAAIAPLRSSTESPDRSSSPESDSLMLNDRDVMTLPLRKRKLYMSDSPGATNGNRSTDEMEAAIGHNLKNVSNTNAATANGGGGSNSGNGNGDMVPSAQKVLRMSSVIQFAKAS